MELPREAGRREHRWAHLMGDRLPEINEVRTFTSEASSVPRPDRNAEQEARIAQLEDRVRDLEDFVERLKSQLGL